MDWDSTPTEAADSESLRREILKHRSSITEASQSFRIPAYNASRETPAQGTRTLRFLGVDPDAEGTPGEQYDFSQLTLSDLLLYTYPWLSGAALALGLAVLAAGHYALSGPHTLRLLPTLAHAALALLGVNFVRGLLTRDSHASLAGSGLATRAADAAATAVHLSAAAHDRLLTARDPALALRSALALWGLTRVGQVLGAWSALTVGFVAAFTLPALAAAHAERLSAAWRALGAAAETRSKALGLTRRHKALALVAALTALWLVSGWATRGAALLAGGLAARCHLRPAELDAIAAHAEPYTQSVRKKARRMSRAAAGFATSRLGMPSATKPRRQ
ncbi:RTN1 [Auxenochlorella protothecoides x Auxenochlorella symbiontica]